MSGVMRDKRTLTLYIFIYVFSECFIQISRQNANFFRLDQNGRRIIGQYVVPGAENLASASVAAELQEEIFKIICNGPVWSQRPVNISNL